MCVEVSCISKFKSTEFELVRDFFGIPFEYQNFFAGNIALVSSHTNWNFILHNPNGDFLRRDASAGFAENGLQRIDIQAIRGLEGQPDWMKELTVYGHEFRMDGKVVAPAAVFAPADALHAVVATTGTATDATLAAKWTYEDGQTVNEESRTISPTADAWTDFMISKPDGWPVGKYKVEISLNGAPAGSREFEVK